MKRGVIALDIDGTITDERHLIPDAVAHYLKDLSENWHIFLITGRSFSFAECSLTKLDFAFTIGFQNGADILAMPEKKLLRRSYITTETLQTLESLFSEEPEDYVVYSGFDRGDFCYYRPHKLSEMMRKHCEVLKTLCPDPWVEFERLPIEGQEAFPLVKYLGDFKTIKRIDEKLKKVDVVKSFSIRDPLTKGVQLALITDREADKGCALKWMLKHQNLDLPVIAAGDDNNDLPMLEMADTKIVIGTAPPHMHRLADIVAKPSTELGIIDALEEAIRK